MMCRVKFVVDVVDQRRQRGRFARAGRAGDEHESAAQMAEFLDHRRDAELLERGDLRRDEPEDGAVAVGLLEEIAAEARVLIHLVGEVEIAAFLEALPALRAADLAHHVGHLVARHDFFADRHDVAVPADLRRLPFAEVQIGGAGVDEHFEELIDVGHWANENYVRRRCLRASNCAVLCSCADAVLRSLR